MLKFIDNTTIQFTGADLKEWYRELGRESIYICRVTMKKISHISGRSWVGSFIESHEMIDELRRAVPNRFMANPPYSSTVQRKLLQKYHSRAKQGSYHTRNNLIRCIPDDFVFTLTLN